MAEVHPNVLVVSGVATVPLQSMTTEFVTVNTSKPPESTQLTSPLSKVGTPFTNVNLRKAFYAALDRKADALEERAWNTYVQRTANLPAVNTGARSDEGILDSHLGTTAGRANAAPAAGRGGSNSSGRAAARGELP